MSNLPDIATCSVTASYQTNKATTAGDDLIIKPTEVSLSFMRYIPVKDDRKKFFVWPQREKETRYAVENVPPIQGWSYRPTVVREGYIYVYFETNVDLFKEFKIEALGGLTNIVSDLSEDIRLPQEERSTRYLCLSIDDVVWIAYSEYQFSASYIQKLRSDQTLRERRMQKFDATAWADNRTAPDCYTVDEIDAYFPLADYATPPEKKDAYGSYYLAPGMDMEIEDQINIQQWVSYFNNVEAIEENPDERDEVFFCLHDPLGCADELTVELQNKWDFMDALIISMQTGLDRHRTYKEIVKGNKGPVNLSDKALLEKSELLHKSLLLLYQAAFCSEENIDKYGKHLDRERMETMLAKEERQQCRADILEAKEQLTSFLKSDYYQNGVLEYSAHTPEIKLNGKARFSLHLSNLQYRVNAKDHVYNLSEDNEVISRQSDSGYNYAKDTFEKGQGILFEKVDIDLKKGGDNLIRVALGYSGDIDPPFR